MPDNAVRTPITAIVAGIPNASASSPARSAPAAYPRSRQNRYTPTADYNGPARLTITTNDLGNTGAGGALSDTDTVEINVTPVNDAPVARDDAATTAEDGRRSLGQRTCFRTGGACRIVCGDDDDRAPPDLGAERDDSR